MKLITPRVN